MTDLLLISIETSIKRNRLIERFSDECGEVDHWNITDFVINDLKITDIHAMDDAEEYIIKYLRGNGFCLQ